METRDEAMAATTNNSTSSANSECSHPIVKGKRTKRQRLLPHSPAPAAAPSSSTTSSSGELSGSTTEEDEDMANCLILLAQGRVLGAGPKSEPVQEDGGGDRSTSRRFAEAATITNNGKAGFYAYECKTCNKCFPSFQALGGHRSSHKKPKIAQVTAAAASEEKRAMDEDNLQISIASNPNMNPLGNSTTTINAATPTTNSSSNNNNNSGINNNKSRVHECSICGSEFSSGQALGGHMRRHRTAVALEPNQEAVKKEKSMLSLDLNLPAPADDDRGDYPKSPSFPFSGGQPLLFSPSALVDCHY